MKKSVKIKIFPWWCSSEHQTELWSKRLLPASGKWVDQHLLSNGACMDNSSLVLELTTDSEEADYHVIICRPNPSIPHDPKRTIVLQMEPKRAYAQIYGEWAKPDRRDYLYLFDQRNSIEWHLERSYDQLKADLTACPLPKCKVISTVMSGFKGNEGQRRRYSLITYLEKIDGFDFYGKHPSNSPNYRGALPYYCKDRGLLDYRYSYAAENCEEDDYFTEKVIDCILAESVPFYWGCPNLDKYIDPRCFIRIDPGKPEEAIEIIREAIRRDEYSKRLPYMRAEKAKIINELQIMPTLARIIREIDSQSNLPLPG